QPGRCQKRIANTGIQGTRRFHGDQILWVMSASVRNLRAHGHIAGARDLHANDAAQVVEPDVAGFTAIELHFKMVQWQGRPAHRHALLTRIANGGYHLLVLAWHDDRDTAIAYPPREEIVLVRHAVIQDDRAGAGEIFA